MGGMGGEEGEGAVGRDGAVVVVAVVGWWVVLVVVVVLVRGTAMVDLTGKIEGRYGA